MLNFTNHSRSKQHNDRVKCSVEKSIIQEQKRSKAGVEKRIVNMPT